MRERRSHINPGDIVGLLRNRMTKIVSRDKRNLRHRNTAEVKSYAKIIQLFSKMSHNQDKAELKPTPKISVLLNPVTRELMLYKENNNLLLECTNTFLSNLSSNTAERNC